MSAPGDIAIIAYNTGQTDGNGSTLDSLRFVAMADIAAGTTIYFTDRAWNGTSFVAGGSDGTTSYTAASTITAGTVIDLPIGGGFDLEQAGDTIYAYTGTGANTPTTFLYAIDIADGNSTFNGNLTNTGLTAGTSAVAVGLDSASYSGPTTEALSHQVNGTRLLASISDTTNWVGDDADGQKALDQPDQLGPFFKAADFQLWMTASAGGDGIIKVDGDATVSSGNVGYNLAQLYTNMQGDPDGAGPAGVQDLLYHPNDIVFDTVHGKFFVADSDLAGHNRILQGNISDLLGNPSSVPSLKILFENTQSTTAGRLDNLEIDPDSGQVYFTLGSTVQKVSYDTQYQAGTQLMNFGTGSGNPAGTGSNFFNDMVIDFGTGNIYLTSTRVLAGVDGDSVSKNYLYNLSGLTSGAGANFFSFGGGNATVMPFSPQDDQVGTGTANPGEAFPKELGTLDGLAIDTVNHILYFSTGEVLLDDDQNTGTAPVYHPGGIYSYALTGNPAGAYGTVFTANNGGPVPGLMSDLEIDPVTGRWYVIDYLGTNGGTVDGQEGIWSGNLNGSGTPTLFANINNINALAPTGFTINHAPIFTSSTAATPTATELDNGAGSGASAQVQPILSANVTDFETAGNVDQLAGAQVRISQNFQSGAGHQDVLTINGLTSGTIELGAKDITFSYNSATGVMTLSGPQTFDNYEAALALVRYSVSGDNPTNFGTAGSRTISWSVSDGLAMSDEQSTTVTVVGVNDVPVNSLTGSLAGTEDVAKAITGLSVSDPDVDPATQKVTVTLSVDRGTLDIRTDVANGLTAGDVTNDESGSVTLFGTLNQINATLANATGVTLNLPANQNGAVQFTVLTTDNGLNGTGGARQDTDVYTISIASVNDAPVVVGDGTESAATIFEDQPSATGESVGSLVVGQYSDSLDEVLAPGGSSAQPLAGVAISGNGSGVAGQWQYFDGTAWVDIGAVSDGAAKLLAVGTLVRFNPAANFNGIAPTLTVHLVDNSAGALVDGQVVDLLAGTGGTTRYSSGTVVIGQDVTAVNDAPTATNLAGDIATWTEGGAAVLLDVGGNAAIADIDSANFDGGSLTVSIGTGLVIAEDQLGIATSGTVSVAGNAVLVGGIQIATFTGGGAGGADLVFTFDADATPGAVQTLIRAITYANSGGDAPTAGGRAITWTLVDGDGAANSGADTLSVTSNVNVVAVNDAPSGTDATITTAEDVPHVFTAADFGFGDVDGNAFAGVVVTTLPGAGTIMFDADGAGGAAPAAITAGTFISAADIALGRLTFAPAANANGEGYATFTFQVRDNGGVLGGGVDTDQTPNTITFDVTAVNDAPVNTVPGAQTLLEDGSVTLSTANGNAISVADVDAGGSPLTVTLSVAHGGLTLASSTGLTFSAGDGSGDALMTFSGTAGAINAALGAGVTYAPDANYNGADSISVTTDDAGSTGVGGALSDSDAISIAITPVNDAPSGADKTLTISEDDPYTFQVADFGFTDGDGNGFLAVKFTTLPTDGVILLNGVPILAGDSIAASAIAAGMLEFVPDLDEVGTPYTSFTFQVQDDGGVANSGVDLDPSANTFTFNVNPDNLAPTILITDTLAYSEDDAATVIAPGALFDDADSLDLDGGTLTVSFTANGSADDQLGVRDEGTAAGEIGVAGSDISYGGTVIGTFGGGANGADLVVSFNVNATPQAVEALTRAITYANNSDTPSTASRTVTFAVTDGDGAAAQADATVTVAAVNDAPVPDLDGTSLGDGAVLAYTENGAAAAIAPNATFADIDSANLDGGSLQVGFSANGEASDRLTILDEGNGAGQIGVAGATISYGGVAFATFTGGTSGSDPLVVTFTSTDATPQAVEALMRLVAYSSTSEDPSTLPRTITWTVNDGDGGATSVDATVNVTAVDDPSIAVGDSYTTNESAVLSGNVAANDADIDSTPTIATVQGVAANVGTQIALASGALLTVNADGTFSYDPNGAFNDLAQFGSGASNTQALDSFTYGLSNGGTATVQVTINGLASNPHILNGTIGDDTITGTNGADIFKGIRGIDSFIGLGGDDQYYANSADDRVTELAGDGNDRIFSKGDYTLRSGVHVETLSTQYNQGTQAIALTGNELDNILIGNAGNNMLDGRGGVDTLHGLDGDDRYFVDDARDRVVEHAGNGYDRIFASVSYALRADSHVEVLSTTDNFGTDAINLTGNRIDNVLIGNNGNNRLDGRQGADEMSGLGGDDYYYVDHADDLVIETVGGGNDRVFTSVDYTLRTGMEVETLSTTNNFGTAAINLTGNDFANTLIGNAGDNILKGRGGGDTLIGFLGDDWYYVMDASDTVVENAGQGMDRIFSRGDYTLGAKVSVEVLSTDYNHGTTAINLTGNELANQLIGNAGNNVLRGERGDDSLHGLAGDDVLHGGLGNDRLSGGQGADSFVFDTALNRLTNVDTIVDFNVNDDTILLDRTIFKAIGAAGTLDASAFHTGTAAQDASDRIIYNAATGDIFYDADGNGAASAVLFAKVSPGLALTHLDFAAFG